jgi:hypothetical protein
MLLVRKFIQNCSIYDAMFEEAEETVLGKKNVGPYSSSNKKMIRISQQ